MNKKNEKTDVCMNDTVNFSHVGKFLENCIEHYKRECPGLKSREICAVTHIGSNTLGGVKKGSNCKCSTTWL